METVRLHISGNVVWAMTKCKVCGDIDKLTIAPAMESPVPCKKCGHHMDIRHATIAAADGRADLDPPSGRGA